MKLNVQINLLHYLHIPQMLARKGTMVEDMEIREIEDMALIPEDKGEIQKLAHIVML